MSAEKNYRDYRLSALLLCGLLVLPSMLPVLPANAQDADSTATQPDDKTADSSSADTEEDTELDEQGYAEQNEDDFEASEDVAADQSVDFPTDI